MIQPIDGDLLRRRVCEAGPFPYFCIDGLLEPGAAERVLDDFPSSEDAMKIGLRFAAVNEGGLVQVTDSSNFAGPVTELNRALASPEFLGLLGYVFDMPDLLADDQLVGGGIHQTGPRGHLDVRVDFNCIADRQLHRRLDILLYFNKDWDSSWGGDIELWGRDVKTCAHSFSPIFNRRVVFETSDISYHGVSAVKCPEGRSRKSFAAYYYTKEAPPHWTGEEHPTVFKARPDEVLNGNVLMPLERARRGIAGAIRKVKKTIKG
jgi:hypothetical protein